VKKKMIKVVIADDHTILRAGLRLLLSGQPDINVVGEAENGEDAIAQVRLTKPNILLADISMSGSSGIEIISEVKRVSAKTCVLILTMHAEPAYLDSALAAGACGYVLKKALDSDLLNAIRITHSNGTFIDQDMTQHLLGKHRHTQAANAVNARHARDLLSRRELQILTLIAQGHTHREIASQTEISAKSVETYRARLLKKLKLTTRRDIVQFALTAGLLSASSGISTDT
jgi:two-component system, NarL family, response regulator NreC